jgi:hypothetical protein
VKKREKASALLVVLSLFLSSSMLNIAPGGVRADSGLPLLQLVPSPTIVQNASQPVVLNLTITNVTDLYGWQASIYFENIVLNCVDASEGSFLNASGSTFWPPPSINNIFNETQGNALPGCILIGNVSGVSGSGVLATMTFQVVGGGNATVHIDPNDTKLIDSHDHSIPYTTADAAVSVPVFHNVAVMNVLPWKTVIGQEYTGNVSITVANTGTASETFSVTVYLNSTAVAAQTITLANGTSQTIILRCSTNTSGINKGRYIVNATVPPLPNEMNTADNTYVDGWINVTIPGDIDGNFWVQLADLVLLAKAYGSRPGDLNWWPNADIDNSGVVGLSDLVILALHYGQKL